MRMLIMLALIISCNGSGGGGGSAPVYTLDQRLLNDCSSGERWRGYNPGTNIDDTMCIQPTTINGQREIDAYWDSTYRMGSALHNSHFILTPTGPNSAYAEEYNVFQYGIGSGDVTYTFIDDDTLQVCIHSGCVDFIRDP